MCSLVDVLYACIIQLITIRDCENYTSASKSAKQKEIQLVADGKIISRAQWCWYKTETKSCFDDVPEKRKSLKARFHPMLFSDPLFRFEWENST